MKLYWLSHIAFFKGTKTDGKSNERHSKRFPKQFSLGFTFGSLQEGVTAEQLASNIANTAVNENLQSIDVTAPEIPEHVQPAPEVSISLLTYRRKTLY